MPAISTRRKLGVEPREIDLTPISSRPLTVADRQEMSEFFQRKRAQNDQQLTVKALREKIKRRNTGL